MNEHPCGDVGGPDKDNPRICTYPDGHQGRHSFDPSQQHPWRRCQVMSTVTLERCVFEAGHRLTHSWEHHREMRPTGHLDSVLSDPPGTVRSWPYSGVWVKRGGPGDSWVLIGGDTPDVVSSYVMLRMGLPVSGVVPGSEASDSRDEPADPDVTWFMERAREHLGMPDSPADVVLYTVLGVLDEARCPEWWDLNDRNTRCTYRDQHGGPHSFEPPRRCLERAADGTLCGLAADHEERTPHDWMPTFEGDPALKCPVFWLDESGDERRMWFCMFEADHERPHSFELRKTGEHRCERHNNAGARCWRAVGHGHWHHYEEGASP